MGIFEKIEYLVESILGITKILIGIILNMTMELKCDTSSEIVVPFHFQKGSSIS